MVELRKGSFVQFLEETKEKVLFCFGSGYQAEWLSEEITGHQIVNKIRAFVDNDPMKAGTFKNIDGVSVPVISFEAFLDMKTAASVMLITSMYFADIVEQMDGHDSLNGMVCYLDFLLENEPDEEKQLLIQVSQPLIPKKIHYCWFGGADVPEEYLNYMESWKRFCPDYEIIRWDESNYDIKKSRYAKQAYDCKKWAFVSDYARLDIIYENGGIYLDTDVELVRGLDRLLYNKMFCGFEQGNLVSTGLGFGAEKGNKHIKGMRDIYDEIEFLDESGRMNETPCPIFNTLYLERFGLKRSGKQQIVDGVTVYSRETLAPETFSGWKTEYGELTFSVHHYNATWRGAVWKEKLSRKNKAIFERIGVTHDEAGNQRG